MRSQFLVMAVMVAVTTTVRAQSVPLLDVDPGSSNCPSTCFYENHTNGSWGWTFYVTSPIQVQAVGWFDQNGDGLSNGHQVGLWKDLSGKTSWPYIGGTPQQLLGANGLVVPAGTTAPLVGAWRTVPVNLTLQPGGYELGGTDFTNSTDGIKYLLLGGQTPPSIPAADPRIQIGAPADSSASGFVLPNQYIAVYGVELGPMLFVTPIPEPATLSLLGLPLISAFGFIRRR